jgi:heat shock protein HslJ
MTRSTTPLAGLAALVLLASACGDDPDGVATAPELDGLTYIADESVGTVEGHELVSGSRITISFQDGSLSANAGCNTLGGSYSLDGSVLEVEGLSSTQMACEPALMDQDTWLAELLSSSPTLTQDGDELTIAGESSSLTLVDREVADPDRPLMDTTWVLDGIVADEAVSSVPSGVRASILITDGRVAVEAGCNTGSGSVEIDESAATLTFGPIATTKMACEPDAMSVEQAVLATLDGEVQYAVEADVLTLTNGDQGLVLRAEE